MAPLSILIVGCGVAGPTLASFLLLSPDQPASERPHITILERSSKPRSQGQNIDIRGAGVTIIRKLGIEGVIRSSTTGEEGVHFVDSDNRVHGAFAADKTGRVQTGTSDIEILRGRLAQICYRRSKSVSEQVVQRGGNPVEYIFGDYLAELEQDDGQKVRVRFAKSGQKREYDVVVGADGLQSLTRILAFGKAGEEERLHRLGLYAGFFSMPSGETDSLWRRWYSAPGRRGIMVRPGDRKDITTVYMAVLNEEKDKRFREVAVHGRKGIQAQKALLEEYFTDAGWQSDRIIKAMNASDDFYYDMVAQVKMDSWSKGRVVLLGDAGYCASPISGMGTTLALNGAYNLAGALLLHPNDHTAAFEHYETTMRPIVQLAQRLPLGGRAHYWLNPETAWGIWLKLTIISWITWSGLINLIARFAGPPANQVSVPEYGLEQLPEWQEKE